MRPNGCRYWDDDFAIRFTVSRSRPSIESGSSNKQRSSILCTLKNPVAVLASAVTTSLYGLRASGLSNAFSKVESGFLILAVSAFCVFCASTEKLATHKKAITKGSCFLICVHMSFVYERLDY